MEENTASGLLAEFPILKRIITDDVDLLMDLQAVHDRAISHPSNDVFGWPGDRAGEASGLLNSIRNEDDNTFNIAPLKRALTFVAYKHNLSPEAI
jgi:hypothetical protein